MPLNRAMNKIKIESLHLLEYSYVLVCLESIITTRASFTPKVIWFELNSLSSCESRQKVVNLSAKLALFWSFLQSRDNVFLIYLRIVLNTS